VYINVGVTLDGGAVKVTVIEKMVVDVCLLLHVQQPLRDFFSLGLLARDMS